MSAQFVSGLGQKAKAPDHIALVQKLTIEAKLSQMEESRSRTSAFYDTLPTGATSDAR